MISHDNYQTLTEISTPLMYSTFFVDLLEDSPRSKESIKEEIHEILGDKVYQIEDAEENVAFLETGLMETLLVIEAIAWVAILMTVLGFVSALSSSYIERTREIAILRTLGLYEKEVNRVFYLEIFVQVVAAGLSGVLAGYSIAYLVFLVLNLFMQIPSRLAFPWGTFFRTFFVSFILLALTLKVLFRFFHKKKTIVESMRQI